jgi:hypothetical protein
MSLSTWLNIVPRRPNRCRPRLEALEARALLSLFTVDRLADLGQGQGQTGDLRYCITNATSGHDTITFAVTGTIDLTGALPDLTTNVRIAGPGPDLLTVRRVAGGDYRIFTVAAGTTAHLGGLTIRDGHVDVNGAGIDNEGTVTVDDCCITGNLNSGEQGGNGAGIYNAGMLTVTKSSITANTSKFGSFDGAGIFNTGTLTVTGSTIADNNVIGSGFQADKGLGGGIYNRGTLSVTSSNVSGNSLNAYAITDAYGGGIFNDVGGSATVSNSTIANNEATGSDSGNGGGMYNRGTLTVTNSTISGNSAYGLYFGQAYAAGIYNNPLYNAVIGLHNTIVAGNVALYWPDMYATLTFSGYNLIGNTAGSSGFDETDLLNVNPQLGPLQDNGGLTHTMALLSGSPAIDAGDNTDAPRWDQRGPGFPRIVNGTIDIGAFEVQQEGDSGGRGTPSPLEVDPLAASNVVANCPTVVPGLVAGMPLTSFAAPLSQEVAAQTPADDGNHCRFRAEHQTREEWYDWQTGNLP